MNWYKVAQGYYNSWANAVWIDPDGEVIDTGGLTHQGWIGESYDFISMNYDIDFLEKIEEIISQETHEYLDERLKTLREEKQEMLDEGDVDGFRWHNVIRELEELEGEDAIYSIEESTRDNFNYTRWSGYVVRELLKNGWVRVVYKHSKYHIEINSLENDQAVKLASDYLFSLDLDPKQMIRFELGSSVTDFSWGEFLNSGVTFLDFIGSGRSWKMSHFR